MTSGARPAYAARAGIVLDQAAAELFERTYREGMELVAEASSYLDGAGRLEARRLSRDAAADYVAESMRLTTPLRQQRDRDALRAGLADGTLDALVSDHMPVGSDEKSLPFAEATPGASGLELLLSLALKWGQDSGAGLQRALATVTCEPVRVLGPALGSLAASAGRLVEGGMADICVFDPDAAWCASAETLHSQGKHTPFAFEHGGTHLTGRVRATVVAGTLAWQAPPA